MKEDKKTNMRHTRHRECKWKET